MGGVRLVLCPYNLSPEGRLSEMRGSTTRVFCIPFWDKWDLLSKSVNSQGQKSNEFCHWTQLVLPVDLPPPPLLRVPLRAREPVRRLTTANPFIKMLNHTFRCSLSSPPSFWVVLEPFREFSWSPFSYHSSRGLGERFQNHPNDSRTSKVWFNSYIFLKIHFYLWTWMG